MKNILRLLSLAFLLFVAVFSLSAKEENGMRVEVQKSTLSNNDDRGTGGYDDRINRTLGLKIFAKNTSMKDIGEGKIEWIMIVSRWGYAGRLERFKGTENLMALRSGQETSFTVGESQIGGYKGYSGQYQDKIEGWSVVVTHNGKPTLTIESTSSFEKLNKRAKDYTEFPRPMN